MLTRAEFRQLFGLPKKRRTVSKKPTAAKKSKKVSPKKKAPLRRKSSSGKKVVRKTSTKLGQKLIAGKVRTVYKSKNGNKYYKKVSKGKVYRMYLGKPVRKVSRKTTSPKRRTTRFGYLNSGASSVAGLMGPYPLSAAGLSTEVAAATKKAAFGKRRAVRKTVRKTVRKSARKTTRPKRRRTTRFGYVNGTVKNLTSIMGPYPLSEASGSAVVKNKFGKKRKVVRRKPVRKTKVGKKVARKTVTRKRKVVRRKPVRKTKVGKKVVRKTVTRKRKVVRRKPVVRRASRFGLMHGRPSQLVTGPYPF